MRSIQFTSILTLKKIVKPCVAARSYYILDQYCKKRCYRILYFILLSISHLTIKNIQSTNQSDMFQYINKKKLVNQSASHLFSQADSNCSICQRVSHPVMLCLQQQISQKVSQTLTLSGKTNILKHSFSHSLLKIKKSSKQ